VRLALTTLEAEVRGGNGSGHLVKTMATDLPPALAADDLVP
jgi:hypothetical protein